MSSPAHAQSASRDSIIGSKVLGAYEIIKPLGEGAMGAVYLARHQIIQQEVAIKVLHEDAARDHETVQRFYREARVVSMLTHPNIIRVLVFGQSKENFYMALEYVEGTSLRERIDQGLIDELVVLKIVKQILSALAEAHDLGIYHRDLKPENILLTNFRGEEHFVKVLDFGIAKLKDPEGSQQLTQAGIVYGTPEYISPEQAQALPLDQRADLYGVGCMLYELITGRVPFDAKSALKVLEMQAFQQPVSPRELAPQRCSARMEKVILKAMAKDPQDRYSSALEMFMELEDLELELIRARKLDPRATHLPGGELSGMFHAVRIRSMEEKVGGSHILRYLLIANAILLAIFIFAVLVVGVILLLR